MKTNKANWTLEIITTLIVIMAFVMVMQLGEAQAGPNSRNFTVETTLNITNSYPVIVALYVDPSSITLNAGSTRLVRVNVTVRDYEGYTDISFVNATFFDANAVSSDSPDDLNNHYTNTSCTLVAGNGNFANYTCHFNVDYFANNGTNWTANATTSDTAGLTDTAINTSTIEILLALNVTDLIDYGNLAVGDTSTNQEANVTNFGNVLINLSVYGYGNVTGDGLAMLCTVSNISVSFERFGVNASLPYASMTSLSTTAQTVINFSLAQRTNDTAGGEVTNSTYWAIQVPIPSNPSGTCNGSIVFQAEQG